MLWLVGAGVLALEYDKVLKSLNCNYSVIGRGQKSARNFSNISGTKVFIGGLSRYLKTNPIVPSKAIVVVDTEELKSTCVKLINVGVKQILLEKPGGVNIEEVKELYFFARKKKVDIKIAYNRRFYSSTMKAKKLINNDGGVQSFNFEFTEWSHRIDKLGKSNKALKNWFFINSTHVIDLAFYLGGYPKEISSYISDTITWKNMPSIFSGAGKSKEGAIFSYKANWQSAGRWSVEILTAKGKYILSPLEKLFFQQRGFLEKKEIKLNSSIDNCFKPGLYYQLKAFLFGPDEQLLSLSEHFSMLKNYNIISGFNKIKKYIS
jgi:hypothetical protein